MSNSLQHHESQHARPPCPSPTSGIHSNSCPSSWRCHPAISSSVVPFSSCPQSLPESESFSSKSALHIRWPKYCSFSFSISPSNEYQGCFPLGLQFNSIAKMCLTLCNTRNPATPGSPLCMRWPKYWSFSFSISPSKEHPGLISKGLSRVFSNTTVQKHQFFGAQLSSQSNSHIHT